VRRALDLPPEDRQLVAQDRVLELRLSRLALVGAEHFEDPAEEQIEERPNHGAALLQTEP